MFGKGRNLPIGKFLPQLSALCAETTLHSPLSPALRETTLRSAGDHSFVKFANGEFHEFISSSPNLSPHSGQNFGGCFGSSGSHPHLSQR